MERIRTVDLQELRARIARGDYVVDAHAVAGAIVGRALVAHRDELAHRGTAGEDSGSSRSSGAAA